MSINRRDFLKHSAAAGAGLSLFSLWGDGVLSYAGTGGDGHKVLILGIDGMDPDLLHEYIAKGLMPNFDKLMQTGDFRKLGTTIPPQSPVAWSTFITGLNPGGHGIFDFIHRDTNSALSPGEPYLSTSKTLGGKTKAIGDWVIPLSKGGVELLRHGKPFWAYLTEKDIPATITKIPSNYPPDHDATKAISCMGTPDMTGGYGTFSYYTDFPPLNSKDITGGVVYPVNVINGTVKAELYGPRNDLKKSRPKLTVPFIVYADSENDVARIVVQDHEFILKVGEWSDWVQVKFDAIPVVGKISGICRFFLKGLKPDFKLYVTPINVDPSNSVLPISYPASYAKEIYDAIGFYYTQGMPENTKALTYDVLNEAEYIQQATSVLEERLRMYDFEFKRFKQGLLFFYFTSLDLNSHMYMRALDPKHPLYDPVESPKHALFIQSLYQEMDKLLGRTLGEIDSNTTLIVMSDHGFAPFRRCFQINTWLKENGYVTLFDETGQEKYEYFGNVDWTRTKAYNLGINGVYLNLIGREKKGIVDPKDKASLLDEISAKLLQYRDPDNGEQAISYVYKTSEVYKGKYAENAPDLILGFNRGYRASWDTILGEFGKDVISDNKDKWSGDHCMAAELVPGVLLANKKIIVEEPTLADIAPTVLAEYGIAQPQQMEGHLLFDSKAAPIAIEPNRV